MRVWRSPSVEEKPKFVHKLEERFPKMTEAWKTFKKNREMRRAQGLAEPEPAMPERTLKSADGQSADEQSDLGEKIPITVKDPTGKQIVVYTFSKTNLQPMFDKIMRRFGYSEHQARDLHFVWKEQELDPTDVPVEIGLEAGSILSLEGEPGRERRMTEIQVDKKEAREKREAEERELREQQEAEKLQELHERDMIHLRFRDLSTHQEVRLAFKRRNGLGNLFKIVCKRMDLVPENTRFVVDLTKASIKEDDTAFALNLHEDDVIRVAKAIPA